MGIKQTFVSKYSIIPMNEMTRKATNTLCSATCSTATMMGIKDTYVSKYSTVPMNEMTTRKATNILCSATCSNYCYYTTISKVAHPHVLTVQDMVTQTESQENGGECFLEQENGKIKLDWQSHKNRRPQTRHVQFVYMDMHAELK
jgi:hypothetical protein